MSLGLLAWLVSRVEPGELAASFGAVPAGAAAAALALYLGSQLASSLRWFLLAGALGFGGAWRRYLGAYFAGMFFNLFLPTSIGGDVWKVFWLAGGEPRRLRAAATVLADRALGFAAMFLLGALAVTAADPGAAARFRWPLVGAAAAAAGLAVLAAAAPGLLRRLFPASAGRLQALEELARHPARVGAAFGLSLLLQGLCMGAVAVLGRGMGLAPPVAFYYAVFPLIALASLLPVSFNGIGVREGGFVFFLGIEGVPAGQALTLGLTFFGVQVAASLLGGLAYGVGLHGGRAGGAA
ncbi:flippase-like domain-containing protein [Dissulfurirhabdus thermomarina]|uniref:Flippase-like domain-containing protein n=1 Tax=Dissulfurirhabdus thermomarina TaxID=1765737 RepID=A0A6N9TN86_DISTH|nr:flippase-like domain-containing protein [Dissulfurirhabdus thermomarina]